MTVPRLSIADLLNAQTPPAYLSRDQVGAIGASANFQGAPDGREPVTVTWHRPDGTQLRYYRVDDHDGVRWYPISQARARLEHAT